MSCVFIAIIPLNTFIIITITIIIMSYPYLLLCHKPIRNILQGERIISHYLIAHFLWFKVIRDIRQLPRVYHNCFNIHPLSFKMVKNRKKPAELMRITSLYIPWVLHWSGIYFSIYGSRTTTSSYISCVLKRSGTHAKEFYAHCFNAQLLHLQMVGDLYCPYLFR